MLGLFLVQSLSSFGPRVRVVDEAFWVYVQKAVFGFGEHPQVGPSSLLFKTLKFRFWSMVVTAWLSFCVAVGHVPSCLIFFQ